jgi:hypothetical protein
MTLDNRQIYNNEPRVTKVYPIFLYLLATNGTCPYFDLPQFAARNRNRTSKAAICIPFRRYVSSTFLSLRDSGSTATAFPERARGKALRHRRRSGGIIFVVPKIFVKNLVASKLRVGKTSKRSNMEIMMGA